MNYTKIKILKRNVLVNGVNTFTC